MSVTAAALAAGCGGGEARSPVSGSVKVNGTALDNGTIYFVPVDPPPEGDRRKNGTTISGGTYTIDTAKGLFPGKYRVEVNWLKKTGKKRSTADGPEMVDETEEGLPDKFHSKSELTAVIAPGPNQYDLDLKP